jgi:hypothetical protein
MQGIFKFFVICHPEQSKGSYCWLRNDFLKGLFSRDALIRIPVLAFLVLVLVLGQE